MEIEIADAAGLPEALKAVAVTADGKTKIDLAKLMPAEDLTGLKTALVRERENAGAYAKWGKPADLEKKITDLEAAAKGTGKGAEEAQAKLDALKSDYDAKLAERDTRLASLMRRQANAELRAELAKAGVVPEGLDILATFAAQRIQFNEDGTPKVVTADGKPMIGSGADHGATLADLAKELAKAIPHLVKDDGKGGGGKQPGTGGKPEKTMSLAEFNALGAKARAAVMREGATLTE